MPMTPEYRSLIDDFNAELRDVIAEKAKILDPLHAQHGALLTRSQQDYAEDHAAALARRAARDEAANALWREQVASVDAALALSLRAIHDRYAPKFEKLKAEQS